MPSALEPRKNLATPDRPRVPSTIMSILVSRPRIAGLPEVALLEDHLRIECGKSRKQGLSLRFGFNLAALSRTGQVEGPHGVDHRRSDVQGV